MLLIVVLSTTFAFVKSWYNPGEMVPGDNEYLGVHDGSEQGKEFLNEWSVLVEGGEEVAQLIALELGYVYAGPVTGFPNTYSFVKYEHGIERRTSLHNSGLKKDKRVRWAEQLFTKMRVKRYPASEDEKELVRVKRLEEASTSTTERYKRYISHTPRLLFNDELWTKQWYLQDTRIRYHLPRLDLNVLSAYAMGYNGSGVRVSILDDGIEHTHSDLRSNYDPEISWDCNDRDFDPSPRKDALNKNSHGTRCAGEIAMTANNVKCGVGVAWGAKVGGVRMLDGRITDRVEAEAIGYAWDKVDIYSASWGPNDDGRTVEGPGTMAAQALKRGILKGRGGKGSIYIWANGNGGSHHDNCNCDGYSSSIYTISIGSASQHGLFPWYGEICPSTLAAAYSSGAYTDQKIATTDTNNTCTLSHTGTSAAAPLAAGIIALVLQANRNLTWRDVQHLIVWTSEYAPLMANPGWQINGVGLRFDVRFGFGLLNAGALVAQAATWVNVPEKHVCRVEASTDKAKRISSETFANIDINVNDCLVNYIEHIQLIVNVHYTRRGALEIFLTSPSGTRVQLLSSRPLDSSAAGFMNWPLMSVATWGENPLGIWQVTFLDKTTTEQNFGEIGTTTLIIHGTNEIPNHMTSGPRTYEYDFFNEDRDDFYAFDFDIDDVNVIPGVHDSERGEVIELNPTVIDEVEQELQRFHHRAYKTATGQI